MYAHTIISHNVAVYGVSSSSSSSNRRSASGASARPPRRTVVALVDHVEDVGVLDLVVRETLGVIERTIVEDQANVRGRELLVEQRRQARLHGAYVLGRLDVQEERLLLALDSYVRLRARGKGTRPRG